MVSYISSVNGTCSCAMHSTCNKKQCRTSLLSQGSGKEPGRDSYNPKSCLNSPLLSPQETSSSNQPSWPHPLPWILGHPHPTPLLPPLTLHHPPLLTLLALSHFTPLPHQPLHNLPHLPHSSPLTPTTTHHHNHRKNSTSSEHLLTNHQITTHPLVLRANLPRVLQSSTTPSGDLSALANSAGHSEQAASSLLQGLERDLLAKPEKQDHQSDDPHKPSSAATHRAPGRVGSDTAALSSAGQRVGVDQGVGLLSAKTSRDELDDFFSAGPPRLPLTSVGQRRSNGTGREGERDR